MLNIYIVPFKRITACATSIIYRRHTDKMIGKLESAGLGFYVKATETQQKLGKLNTNSIAVSWFIEC